MSDFNNSNQDKVDFNGDYDRMILGQMADGKFATNESCAEIIDCFMRVATSERTAQCAAVYAKTALFNNLENVFHFVRPNGDITCVKLAPTSKVDMTISSQAVTINMNGIVAKLIDNSGDRTQDKLVDLTIKLPLHR